MLLWFGFLFIVVKKTRIKVNRVRYRKSVRLGVVSDSVYNYVSFISKKKGVFNTINTIRRI